MEKEEGGAERGREGGLEEGSDGVSKERGVKEGGRKEQRLRITT